MAAAAAEAAHEYRELCALADVRARAGSPAGGLAAAGDHGTSAGACSSDSGTCSGATGRSAGGRTRLLGRRETRIMHPMLSLYGSNDAHVR